MQWIDQVPKQQVRYHLEKYHSNIDSIRGICRALVWTAVGSRGPTSREKQQLLYCPSWLLKERLPDRSEKTRTLSSCERTLRAHIMPPTRGAFAMQGQYKDLPFSLYFWENHTQNFDGITKQEGRRWRCSAEEPKHSHSGDCFPLDKAWVKSLMHILSHLAASHIPLKLPGQTCMYFLLSVTLLGPLLVTHGDNSYPYRDRSRCSTLKWWDNASPSWHTRKKEWTNNWSHKWLKVVSTTTSRYILKHWTSLVCCPAKSSIIIMCLPLREKWKIMTSCYFRNKMGFFCMCFIVKIPSITPML